MAKTILEYDTVSLDEESGALVIIDQTQLPGKIELLPSLILKTSGRLFTC